jgi:hypothetical protein
VLYINSPNGNNNVGYYSGDHTTLANWQSANAGSWDQSSMSADPVFTNENANIFLPNSYVINDMCTPVGVTQDIVNLTRSTTQPDPGAREFLNTPCSGLSLTTSAVAPGGMICPNTEVFLGLSHTFTNSGITFQWQYSTASPFGPFTPVTGATLPFLASNTINTTTYFNAVITCTNGGANITSLADTVLIAPPTTDTIPYFESFESIPSTNRLPNCSWYSNNLGSTALTYTIPETSGRVPRTGNNYASFYYNPTDSNYFYTNGLLLKPGVTYSAALWYRTEYYGYTNWSDLSILIGTSQSPAGLSTIASTNGPALSNVYKLLSGTFTVPAAGLYHVAVRGTANGSGAQYLTWDDLSVTIPCSLNSPTILVSSSSSVACSGTPVFLNAAGADSYLWSNGASGSAITVNPLVSGYYSVTGTSTLSGCAVTGQQYINVNPSPQVGAYISKPSVCAGMPIAISAFGASSYSWSTGGHAQHITVSPSSTSNYTVLGSNSYGCVGNATVQVIVNPLPSVTANAGLAQYCAGDQATLTAGGAASYTWITGSAYILTGNPLTVIAAPGTYTIQGADMNGCLGTTFLALNVSECTGLEKNSFSEVKVFPNPASTVVNIQVPVNSSTFELCDLTGRVLLNGECRNGSGAIDISGLPAGVYMVRVKDSPAPVKIIKE